MIYMSALYQTQTNVPLSTNRVEYLDPSISRFRPKLYYAIFLPADLACLVLQAVGGALSTTSQGGSDVAVKLALAGLGAQVVVLVIFCVFFVDYIWRYFRSPIARVPDPRLKLFLWFLALAILLILARCAYRVDELSEGYSGHLIHDEPLFIALEGV